MVILTNISNILLSKTFVAFVCCVIACFMSINHIVGHFSSHQEFLSKDSS